MQRDGQLERARTVSRVADLDTQAQTSHLDGAIGIAHTRWATHGKPDTVNANPHFSGDTIALDASQEPAKRVLVKAENAMKVAKEGEA